MMLAARMCSLGVSWAVAFGLLYPCAPAFAQVSFLGLSGTGVPGNLALSLGGVGAAPAGLQWTLVYSLSQISSIGAVAGPVATAAGKTLSCNSTPGFFTCLVTGLNRNAISAGVVAYIQLTSGANTTTPSISIWAPVAVDATGSGLPVSGLGLAPPSPQISGPGNLGEISLGNSISGAVTASGGSPPYTFTASGLPAGVTLSGNSITGTPTVPGVYSIGVTVTDSNNATATTTISFSVFGIVTSSLPQAVTSSPYSFYVTAAGGALPYTFSASGLPPSFSFTNGGWFSGTASAPGTYTISFTATDAHGVSNSASFPFVITLPPPLTVPGGPLSGTTAGTPYSQTISAAGGAPPYTWTLAGGSLPDGTNLQATGTLAGTPDKPGSYTFTAKATDQIGTSAVGTFSITVAPLPVTITTPSPLASGTLTIGYPVQVFSASGGVAPYTYTAPPNSLPPGLILSSNGAITGTPAVAGRFAFTLTAADSNGQTGNASFQITVRPFSTDLIISAGALSFSLAAGATLLPATQAVQVQSTDVTQALSWSTAITPAATWLSVSPGGTTPGFFSVALTSTASSLAASATPYQATIMVSCLAPSPCAGSSQTIAVSLLVSAAPPQLTVFQNLLSFTTSSTNPQATTQSVVIENTGGGNIGFASFTCPATWCETNALPVSIGVQTINITADPTGLSPGFYYTDLTIDTPVGTAVVPITLFIASNSILALNPAGAQLVMPAGGVVATPETSFLVSASNTAPVAWTATVLPGAPWLNLATPSGSSTSAAPGAVSYSINQTEAAALAPQVYYGTIRVASTGAANSPQDFQVALDVTAATVPQTPVPSPAGLIFLISVGDQSGSAAPPQTVQVFASSATAIPYQAAAVTADGNSWLSVSPATGTTSASSPAQSSITVSPTGLTPGVYRGNINYSLAAAAVPSVNVTLVIEAPAQTTSLRASMPPATAASCSPTQIVPTETGLVYNFAAPASMPTPIEIQLVDDCGSPVTNSQIVTTFSNGDPPLELNLENSSLGLYSGTWTPRTPGSQVTVTATVTPAAASTRISGAVVPNVGPNIAPVLAPNGTLHVFTPEAGAPLAPGTIVQIYGSSLATQTVAATALPLPTNLAGTSVMIGGLPATLFAVSPGQVTAQIPFELAPGQPYQVIVSNNGALSTPESIQAIAATPGVASLPSGHANAQHASDGSAITDASPARPGEYIVIYLAGMGPTTVPIASGVGSPFSPLAQTVDAPTITLNSEPVSFLFSGLTPGLVGLYQIDLQVPADAQNGDLLLVVSQPGFQGSPVILPVHQ
jgi:large repetitive protein